jgi:hypothetical protein
LFLCPECPEEIRISGSVQVVQTECHRHDAQITHLFATI